MRALPPSLEGGAHDTDTLLPSTDVRTLLGSDGTVACAGAGTVRVLPTASAPVPALLRAEMRNW
ncbi:MAG: hypothetical protein OXG34_10275 [bacterium]|nr:hypothetical protein [bacterium]MCY3962030.1 hypothetical protein [bacterium]